MLNKLARYRALNNRGQWLASGHHVEVYWDDVNEEIVVYDYDSSADTTPTVRTSGPDLGARLTDFQVMEAYYNDPRREHEEQIRGYTFCDGADLQYFTFQSLFPYITKVSSPGHFSCALNVCDLQISDDYEVQGASDFVTPDGSISVTATSSNGAIKFSLDAEFDFQTEGQSSGDFPGLYAGDYTVTAKDELGCFDQININVPVPDFYNPIYRLEYDATKGAEGAPISPTRIDILERGYEGDITEVKGGNDPFILRYNGDGDINKFTPIIASEARLTIISETNFQFRHLFTQDERKYQIRYYKSPGVSADFTPAVLEEDLSQWIEASSPYGVDWLSLSPPNVQFLGNGSSRRIYTLYQFEPGRTYAFDYSVTVVGEHYSADPGHKSYFRIEITNAIGDNLGANFQADVTGEDTFTGTHTFTAPIGADRIRLYFLQVLPGMTGSEIPNYTINSFTNATGTASNTITLFDLKWLGYVISSNYSEAYLAPPYHVTIVATDGLADLKTYDYLDKDGNKYRDDQITLTAITEILSKTDLSINIQSAINRYEEDMDQTDTDDPLNQCKFNPETFYHGGTKKCDEVLEEILKPFGARILQRNGKWCIYSIEEFVSAADYREFDSNGVYLGEGIINDVVDIDVPVVQTRAAFINRQQVLGMIPTYGKLFFEHSLITNESLIKGHGFELEDLTVTNDGVVQLNGWNVNISSHPGATYGIKKTEAFDSDYNFYVTRGGINYGLNSGQVIVTALPFTVEYEAKDAFEFRFNYAVILSAKTLAANVNWINPLWVKIKYMMKVGSYYFNDLAGTWTDDINYKYNNVYCSNFNSSQEYKIVAPFRGVTDVTTETAEIEFVLTYETTVDFIVDTGGSSALAIAALKDIVTTTLNVGHRIKGRLEYTGSVASYAKTFYWILVDDEAADNGIETVLPDDYDLTTNAKVWDLEDSLISYKSRTRSALLNDNPAIENTVQYNYLDNIIFRHLPNQAEPPENVTIQRNNNAGIKINFEEQYLLNDIDLENINNSERTYKNYFKKLDGTPTQVWARSYREGEGKLLELLSNDIVSQYKRGSNKLTGSFITDTEVLPTSVMNEVNDGDKKYMFMGYELRDKSSSIGFDLLEVQDTITDPDSDDVDAEFNTDFSLDFHS
jgi:hypothetical protein